MLSPEQIARAKAVSIVAYLASRGVEPVRQVGQEWAYRSPVTNERSASFFVNPAKNVFNDYSGQQQGDAIRLVRYLTGCDFVRAVEQLLSIEGNESFSFSGPLPVPIPAPPSGGGGSSPVVLQVRPLTHPALLRYVQSRGIAPDVARRYCQEVQYEVKGREFFAVGFANDGGGFALRSPTYKGQTAPAGIATMAVPGSTSASVFEGFFDFLSACQLLGQPTKTVFVLNSTAHVARALPLLQPFARLDVYFDRDSAGCKALDRLRREGLPVVDRSPLYDGFNDLNGYLLGESV